MKKNRIYLLFLVIGAFFAGCSWFMNSSDLYEDENQNKVWDDMEPEIAKLARTTEQKKAVEAYVISLQELILNPELGYEHKKLKLVYFEKTSECMKRTFGYKSGDIIGFDIDLKNKLINSKARFLAWIKYNANLSGGVFGLWDDEKHGDPCAS